jgi:hypothetical protein
VTIHKDRLQTLEIKIMTKTIFMKNLKFYSIFIFSLISFFTQAQDYSFVINKMYSGDNSTRRIILQEATEEHGKTSLIIGEIFRKQSD